MRGFFRKASFPRDSECAYMLIWIYVYMIHALVCLLFLLLPATWMSSALPLPLRKARNIILEASSLQA